MTTAQKFGRVLALTITLVVGSILVAMLGALGLFIMEKGRELHNRPEFQQGVIIVVTGIAVNILCVVVLLWIKRMDTRLVPPSERPSKQP